jgi:hypothetical protein
VTACDHFNRSVDEMKVIFLASLLLTSSVFADGIVVPQLELESITDLPKEALDGDPIFVQQEDDATTVIVDALIKARQGENIDYEEEDESVNVVTPSTSKTTTEHWSTKGCTGANEYFNSCGPRCVQTCTFQPRAHGRTARAACESIFSGSCHAGCFCVDG